MVKRSRKNYIITVSILLPYVTWLIDFITLCYIWCYAKRLGGGLNIYPVTGGFFEVSKGEEIVA
jgi:hypothetical protein